MVRRVTAGFGFAALALACRSSPQPTLTGREAGQKVGQAPEVHPTVYIDRGPATDPPIAAGASATGLSELCRGDLSLTVTHHRGARARATTRRAVQSHRREIALCLRRAGVQDRQTARLHLAIEPSGEIGSWLHFHDRGDALVRCTRKALLEGFAPDYLSFEPTEISLELSYETVSCPL